MKHIAVCIAAVVAIATPALAQQGAQSQQQPNVATSGHARSHVAGRFHLDIANGNDGALNRIDEEHPDENATPALNDQAAAQAQSTTPQVQVSPPQTVTQSQQNRTQPRFRPNP